MQEQTQVIDEVENVPQEETKPKVSRNNGLGKFLKSRERVFFKYGKTYNVGRNKAKREKRGK